MFCSNCGKQIPDNTNFCSYCGAKQEIVNNPKPASETPQNQGIAQTVSQPPPQKSSGKAGSILITAVVVVGAFLIGKFAIAPSMLSDGKTVTTTTTANNNGGSSIIQSSAGYDDIFRDTSIIHLQSFFGVNTASYALKQDDGTIHCADYGYDNDVVTRWTETMYLPISDYTDAQKTELENTMRSSFASIDSLICCSVSYKMSANYFTVTCEYTDVDKEENYSALYNAGILKVSSFISMSATEESLLAQNFVKK